MNTTTNTRGVSEAMVERYKVLHQEGMDRYVETERAAGRKPQLQSAIDAGIRHALAALSAQQAPIPMLLFCPQCNTQHIDAPDERTPDWNNPPHRSHLCHACGCIWRPADVPTIGVEHIVTRGKADTFDPAQPAERVPEGWAEAYAAFKGAFDTSAAWRRDSSDYAEDARRRMRELNERLTASPAPSPARGDGGEG